jgi:signal peptidase I
VFDLNDGYGTKYLKRVVGLPGETIELRSNKLIRDGQPIAENYPATDAPVADFGPVVLGEGQYFVLGDNRARSKDSRYIGPISHDQLRGLVRLRWLAIDGEVAWDRFPFVFDYRDR